MTDYNGQFRCKGCGKMLGYEAVVVKNKKHCKKCKAKLEGKHKEPTEKEVDDYIGRGIDIDG